MKKSPFNPYSLQWHEGMFMLPQHFQQQDLLQKNLWSYHLSLLSPYHWGIRSLEIDASVLSRGILRVLKLEAVFPDGSVIFFPHESEDALEIKIRDVMKTKRKSHKIFLTIPNVLQRQGQQGSKMLGFQTVDYLVADASNLDSKAQVSYMKPVASLEVEENLSVRRLAFPVVEVVQKDEGFALTEYLPPMVTFQRDHAVIQKVSDLVGQVQSKLIYLQKKLRVRNNQLTSGTETDVQSVWQLDMMRRHLLVGLAPLEAMLGLDEVPPYRVYENLLNLQVQCSALHWGAVESNFPKYQHDDLQACFQGFFKFFDTALEHIKEPYRSYVFQSAERVFSLEMKKEWAGKPLVLGVQAASGQTDLSMNAWVKSAVIASDSSLRTIQSNRVLGIERSVMQTDEGLGIIPDRGTTLCRLVTNSEFLTMGEVLHIFNISDDESTRPSAIVLYVPDDLEKTESED